jgi:hypothetical protein
MMLMVAIPSLMKSQDTAWLQGFRSKLANSGSLKILEAIDIRLRELGEAQLRGAVGKQLTTLTQRVHEAIRGWEGFFAHKHGGKRIGASRTNAMIERWGEKEAVPRIVMNMNMSNGLELLAKYGRLDCAYGQIFDGSSGPASMGASK